LTALSEREVVDCSNMNARSLNDRRVLGTSKVKVSAERKTFLRPMKNVSRTLSARYDGDTAALALLDCSAAFDTVDHNILLCKLSESFGVNGTALQWLIS
jgi:tRNA A37 threonylcarbamoyladenosine dehydratase